MEVVSVLSQSSLKDTLIPTIQDPSEKTEKQVLKFFSVIYIDFYFT